MKNDVNQFRNCKLNSVPKKNIELILKYSENFVNIHKITREALSTDAPLGRFK